MESALYGGLDDDEDDEVEAADVALSPLKPIAAAQMSKVSLLCVFKFMITPLLISMQYCSRVSLYSVGSHLPSSMQGDKVIANSPMAHLTVGGGHLYLSQLFSNMLVAQIRMSGPSNTVTPFKHFKQFGIKFTKVALRITGGKSNTSLRSTVRFMKWYINS
jgi:hypothetical protein